MTGEGALRTQVLQLDSTSGEADGTGYLASLLVAVGAAAAAGCPRSAAVLLGVIDAHAPRLGYDPLRMDPVDGSTYVSAARAALDPDDWTAAQQEGAGLDLVAATALLVELAGGARQVDLTGGGQAHATPDRTVPSTGGSAVHS